MDSRARSGDVVRLDVSVKAGKTRQKIIDEQGHVDTLMEQNKAWQVAQQLRDYVQAVRGAGYYAQPAITGGRDLEAWCDWALDQASRLDPTVSNPPSVLEYKEQFFWRR